MARARDPNRDIAFELYKESNGNMLLKEIAERIGKSEGTVRGWKAKDKWDEKINGAFRKNERSVPLKNTERSDEGEAEQSAVQSQSSERKRGGNPNPPNQFPKRNKVAEKHGFFSKVIPEELQDLFAEIEDEISTADMLWHQIKLQYMAIMRAQSIMFVQDKHELVKEIKKERYGYVPGMEQQGDDTVMASERILDEVEYEIQFAWDRHAQFLTAQSRAISELRTSINQFHAVAHEDDVRCAKLDLLKANLDKTKAEIVRLEKMNEAGNQETAEQKLAEYFRALQGEFTDDKEESES